MAESNTMENNQAEITDVADRNMLTALSALSLDDSADESELSAKFTAETDTRRYDCLPLQDVEAFLADMTGMLGYKDAISAQTLRAALQNERYFLAEDVQRSGDAGYEDTCYALRVFGACAQEDMYSMKACRISIQNYDVEIAEPLIFNCPRIDSSSKPAECVQNISVSFDTAKSDSGTMSGCWTCLLPPCTRRKKLAKPIENSDEVQKTADCDIDAQQAGAAISKHMTRGSINSSIRDVRQLAESDDIGQGSSETNTAKTASTIKCNPFRRCLPKRRRPCHTAPPVTSPEGQQESTGRNNENDKTIEEVIRRKYRRYAVKSIMEMIGC